MLSKLDRVEMPADAVEVARIVDAWGVQGWFKVLPYSSRPEALFSSKRWFLLPPIQGRHAFEGPLCLSIQETKAHAESVLARAHDVPDRSIAEQLRGARVFVPRASFPSAGRDEYYWVDLIGLEVFNRQDEPLGVVRELLTSAAQTVLVLEFTQADKVHTRMIPFVAAYVDDVDLVARRIRVDWQADY